MKNPDNCCQTDRLATLAAALAHPSRLLILSHLSGHGACCCKDVVQKLDLAQSTVSQHLKVLVEAGLVRFSPEQQRSRYTVDTEAVERLSAQLSAYLAVCAGVERARN
ncbi:MAG: metalloregulator ArsR/SmtB family transcription factor [Mesorhizobium sp.]